ncbi:hypothetical protein [Pseudomonas sp. 2FE]|uniref:hypothetical protein n=1 Tax=Pseudomonas sp. 2FE TaxID=2502190 RepID=UPI0010F8A13C|nr:hypothetical protein [Pseudomonas sp. 2FE]
MTTVPLPAWLETYRSGDRLSKAQANLAYASYYCMAGESDMEVDVEERLGYMPPSMVAYASRTGTRRNLDALRNAGWRLLVSAAGVLRTEGFERYALDNGAWSAFQQGRSFDEAAFGVALDKLGEHADWVVIPDIVAGGMESLDFSVKWLDRLQGFPQTLLLAVQDGMQPDDVRELLNPSVGIFVGGSTAWKLKTMESWGVLARRRNCYLHVGRVNSARRIAMCAAACASSFDGTSATRFAQSLPNLDDALGYAVNQSDLFSVATENIEQTPFNCRWPLANLEAA